MSGGVPDDLALDPRRDKVLKVAHLFGGVPHGDDAQGLMDISFRNIVESASFISMWRDYTTVTLRGPVSSLTEPVVIQVQCTKEASA